MVKEYLHTHHEQTKATFYGIILDCVTSFSVAYSTRIGSLGILSVFLAVRASKLIGIHNS